MVYLGSVNARCCCGKWKWRKQLTKNSVVKRSWIISGKKKKIILYAIGSLVICKKEKGRRRKQNKKRSFFVFFFPRFVFTFRKTPPLHGFSREFVVEKRPSSSIFWRWMNEGFWLINGSSEIKDRISKSVFILFSRKFVHRNIEDKSDFILRFVAWSSFLEI